VERNHFDAGRRRSETARSYPAASQTTGQEGPKTAIKNSDQEQGTVMIKALSAVAAAAVVASAVSLLPAFTPQVEASVPPVLAKGDRLDIHGDCGQQSWPNFDASCLRASDNDGSVRQVRVVSVDRAR
jgi:hypothetical protein